MFQIQRITSDARQKQTLLLPDGTQFDLNIYFVPMQYGWFITGLTYQSFVLKGLRISNSPNLLFQYKNKIPFGLACFSRASREPTQQDDFASGYSGLYILNSAEVAEYADFLRGEI